jgi:hypothetical protein
VFARDIRRLGQLSASADAAAAAPLHQALQAAHPALLEQLMRLQLRESA